MGQEYVANVIEDLVVSAGSTVSNPTQTPFNTGDCRLVTLSFKIRVPVAATGSLSFALALWNTEDWDNVPFAEDEIPLTEGDAEEGIRTIICSRLVEIGEGRKVKFLELDNGDPDNDVTIDYIKALKLFG